jgi:hypothetical protein
VDTHVQEVEDKVDGLSSGGATGGNTETQIKTWVAPVVKDELDKRAQRELNG